MGEEGRLVPEATREMQGLRRLLAATRAEAAAAIGTMQVPDPSTLRNQALKTLHASAPWFRDSKTTFSLPDSPSSVLGAHCQASVETLRSRGDPNTQRFQALLK